MHPLGKVLLWLNVLLIAAGFFFTTRAFQVRNSWQKMMANSEKQYAQNIDTLEKARLRSKNLLAELDRNSRPWGSVWTGIKVAVNPAPGDQAALDVTLGTPLINPVDAQGQILNPVLHAFIPLPENKMLYAGEFRVQDLQQGHSVMVPTRFLRPGEAQRWVAGDNWHFRAFIPGGDQSLFNNQEIQMVLGLERLNTRRASLQRLEETKAQSEKLLKMRVGEIEGIAELQAKKDALPPEYVQGLLKTLHDEEQARNQLAADVQKLREELFETQKSFDEIRSLNAQLMEQLDKSQLPGEKAVTLRSSR